MVGNRVANDDTDGFVVVGNSEWYIRSDHTHRPLVGCICDFEIEL
jgi:hypothetical protein